MYKVTDEQVEEILETAGFVIGYWATSAHIDSRARKYAVQDSNANDSMLPVEVSYDYILTKATQIALGEYEMSDRVREYFKSWLTALNNDDEDSQYAGEHIDGEAADVLVQVAILNEVVYG